MQDEKLTNHKVALILGVSDRRADQMANSGLLPFETVSTGNNRMMKIFKRSDVEAFMKRREAENAKKLTTQSQAA